MAASAQSPVLCNDQGETIQRNFVHVEDLVDAILLARRPSPLRQQTFNIAMDEPVDYRRVAEHLARTRGLPSIDIRTPYHSTWLDNTKAKFLLGWRPQYDLPRLIDEAWDYQCPDRRSPPSLVSGVTSKDQLSLMRPDAIIIFSTPRPCCRENAMLSILDTRRIATARGWPAASFCGSAACAWRGFEPAQLFASPRGGGYAASC